jgi:hypothetical protein
MRSRVVARCILALALAFGTVPTAWAQPSDAIGKVATVTGLATIEHTAAVVVQANVGSGAIAAKAGDFVYLGDTVQTTVDGKISLIFSDGTAFNLSSNARMVLNEFVYDPKSSSNSTFFSLAKGNFTFVAGRVAKTGNMTFDTPVATMGIRGTTPQVEVLADGSVRFSTLVEEDSAAPSPDSQRNNSSRPSPPENDAFKRQLKLDLNICRGC